MDRVRDDILELDPREITKSLLRIRNGDREAEDLGLL